MRAKVKDVLDLEDSLTGGNKLGYYHAFLPRQKYQKANTNMIICIVSEAFKFFLLARDVTLYLVFIAIQKVQAISAINGRGMPSMYQTFLILAQISFIINFKSLQMWNML